MIKYLLRIFENWGNIFFENGIWQVVTWYYVCLKEVLQQNYKSVWEAVPETQSQTGLEITRDDD